MNLANNGNMPFAVDRELPQGWAPRSARLKDTFGHGGRGKVPGPPAVRLPRLHCDTAREGPRLINQLLVGQELEIRPRWAAASDVLANLRAEEELRRDTRRFAFRLSPDRLTVLVERMV